MANSLRRFIEAIFPLYRSICSPGLDEALEILRREFIPELIVEGYPTGTPAWTWILPQKWELRSGSLSYQSKEIISTRSEPLSVWSGSLPVDTTVSYDTLMKHIYTDSERPELLCWYFRYYGKLDWGFNLPHNLVKTLDPKADYRVQIDARYYDDLFKVGYTMLKGRSDQIILVSSDICHPFQCNDSLSGAAVSYELYRHLQKKKDRFFTYLFTFLPETIGTIAFLSHHEDLLPRIVYHLYTEFWGRKTPVRLQKSLRGDSLMDRVALEVLERRFGSQFQTLRFREDELMNDEKVTTMANLWIPSVALNRGSYREYHTHQDVPEKLDYAAIEEGFEIMRDILEAMEKTQNLSCHLDRGSIRLGELFPNLQKPKEDFIPVPLFKGPVFLSRYNLWVDWRTEPELSRSVDLLMACMDGQNSVAEIAAFVKLSFTKVLNYMKRFEAEGLIQTKNEPVLLKELMR
jgi:aminopeptidase-like protein